MAKKSKITGIDALFTSTDPAQEKTQNNQGKIPQHNEEKEAEEETARIDFCLPASMKEEIKIHCIQNRITMKDFIISAIRQRLT
jgi:hypothetical protein